MMQLLRKAREYLRTLGKFIGPGFMIAVGYLDPGNWATDMEGGSSYGYRLLFIILLSNIIAIFLQNMTIRLGTISGYDLASASKRFLPKYVNLFLYVLAELAIIATDIAEVIGSAIALNLLFPKLPLPVGVAITAVDVFIILLFYNEEPEDPNNPEANTASLRMVRCFEMFVMLLVIAVGTCFVVELTYSNVVVADVFKGYLPSKEIFTDPNCLYISIGIIGATVMPHNLYLHSFIVQARCRDWRYRRPLLVKCGDTWLVKNDPNRIELRSPSDNEESQLKENEKTIPSSHTSIHLDHGSAYESRLSIQYDILKSYLHKSMKNNLHYGLVDLIIALLFAFFVNSAILIVAAANFFYAPDNQQQHVEDLFSAHALLLQYLGPPAAVVFALALLCSGQSSTLTATLAGQVIMSGFLGMTTRPWVRRIITRLIAIVPAMLAASLSGRSGLSTMLVASQVALSIQLPFAVVPLIYFTARKETMKLDIVVEYKEPVFTEKKTKVNMFDRFISKLQFPSFKSKMAALKQFFIPSNRKMPRMNDQKSTKEECGSSSHDTPLLEVKTWPEALTYPNGIKTNIAACMIATLLIGLNSYLVVTLFMSI
ncbi:natural resistance-associated macrophage protein-domain-containing protein [Pilobolus umbonatus]|nr:natural resistance-associated macrophage protein-domain-containing protein [Pilobolus umbonatus]